MKKKHLLNIGYPKCSTTWLWDVITSQEWFSPEHNVHKENFELLQHGDIQRYYETYQQFDISANFATAMFAIDRYLIKQLADNPQIQVSIIVRNLFELNFSLYNFLTTYNKISSIDYQDNLDNLFEQGSWWKSPATIIQRWMEFFDSTRFKVFLYDDIKESNNEFLKNYCLQMDLPPVKEHEYPAINLTRYNPNAGNILRDHQIEIINEEIEKLEFLLEKDLSHWKQK